MFFGIIAKYQDNQLNVVGKSDRIQKEEVKAGLSENKKATKKKAETNTVNEQVYAYGVLFNQND